LQWLFRGARRPTDGARQLFRLLHRPTIGARGPTPGWRSLFCSAQLPTAGARRLFRRWQAPTRGARLPTSVAQMLFMAWQPPHAARHLRLEPGRLLDGHVNGQWWRKKATGASLSLNGDEGVAATVEGAGGPGNSAGQGGEFASGDSAARLSLPIISSNWINIRSPDYGAWFGGFTARLF
jgi:hypothetical protein